MKLTFSHSGRRGALALLVAWATALLLACGGGGPNEEPPPSPPEQPVITVQPAPVSVVSGSSATFSVTATGMGLRYQWQRSSDGGVTWVLIGGATLSTYVIALVDITMNGHQYRVAITATAGALTSVVYSPPSSLAVSPTAVAPGITTQPVAQTVAPGGNALFSVSASGTALSYQWLSSSNLSTWVEVNGATGPTLLLSSVPLSLHGTSYRVRVSNTVGTVFSNAVPLSVTSAPDTGLAGKLGVWTGTGNQSGLTWTIRVDISTSRQLIEYPSLSCGGTLTLLEDSTTRVLFREAITYGAGCVNAGYVELRDRADGTLTYNYYYLSAGGANGVPVATGVLTRN
jgi:hypothetical protein